MFSNVLNVLSKKIEAFRYKMFFKYYQNNVHFQEEPLIQNVPA